MFSFRTTPLENQLDKALTMGKVGCFCTQNSWDTASGRYMSDLFRDRGNLAIMFSPRDTELTPGTNHSAFEPEALDGLDAVVVEIQDAGARYFNYSKDVFHLMEVLRTMENAPALYIVDHINPAGRIVEGSMPFGTVEPHTPKVAHRHGLTLGELCGKATASMDNRPGIGYSRDVHLPDVFRRRPLEQHDNNSGDRNGKAL